MSNYDDEIKKLIKGQLKTDRNRYDWMLEGMRNMNDSAKEWAGHFMDIKDYTALGKHIVGWTNTSLELWADEQYHGSDSGGEDIEGEFKKVNEVAPIVATGGKSYEVKDAEGKTVQAYPKTPEGLRAARQVLYKNYSSLVKQPEQEEAKLNESKKDTKMKNKKVNESIDVNITSNSDGHSSVTVTATNEHSEELLALLKSAGLQLAGGTAATGSCGAVSADTVYSSVTEEDEYANQPNEKVADIRVLLDKLSGGLNKPKKQYKKEYPGDNPMAVVNVHESAKDLYVEYQQFLKDSQLVENATLAEKAVSKSQQKAAGAALAAKRGDIPKSKLKGASKEMVDMSTKELEKFAGTKHKGLPEKKKVKEESIDIELDESEKPDFLDLDKDGDRKESMKKAASDAKKEKNDNNELNEDNQDNTVESAELSTESADLARIQELAGTKK